MPAGVQQEVRETRATPKPVRTGSMKIPVGRVNEVLKQAEKDAKINGIFRTLQLYDISTAEYHSSFRSFLE